MMESEQPQPCTSGGEKRRPPSLPASSPSAASESMSTRLAMLLSPARKSAASEAQLDPLVKLRQAALTFRSPSIFTHEQASEPEKIVGATVADWNQIKRGRSGRRDRSDSILEKAVQKVIKVSKSKGGHSSGRTYTSKYRGVHQTFPTKRWEAQFRRNGKPTSLGCFDQEEEAARAYDKMMLWCELHQPAGLSKTGITNFELSEYEKDVPTLNSISQDELVQALRSDGRRQATQRILRQKRDGHVMMHHSGYSTP